MRSLGIISAAIICMLWATVESCTHPPDHLFDMILTEFDTSFRFLRHNESLEKSKLKMIYEWKPYVPYGEDFDGYLYKLLDRDDTNHSRENRFPDFADLDFDPKACFGLNNTVWANGSAYPVQCNLPCEKHFPPICGHGKLCSLLRKGYKVLSPKTKKLEFHVEFGHVYDLNIYVYRHWYTGKNRIFNGASSVRYCKDELITNQKVGQDDATTYCKSVDYGKTARIMGPVSHFRRYSVIRNLTNNRATVTFRWKVPYDIAPNASLMGFSIYTSKGNLSENQILVKMDPLEPNPNMTEHYEMVISDLEFEKKALVSISPFLKELGCVKKCQYYGASLMEYFEIDDINACDPDNEVGRYCDDKAMCIDQPSNSSISAKCTCHQNFTGNGISTKWSEGTGCHGKYDVLPNVSPRIPLIPLSPPSVQKIAPSAEKLQQSPPDTTYPNQNNNFSTSTFGGGKVDDSHQSLIVGLCLGIPLLILILIIIGCWCWKKRNRKNKMARLNEENL